MKERKRMSDAKKRVGGSLVVEEVVFGRRKLMTSNDDLAICCQLDLAS